MATKFYIFEVLNPAVPETPDRPSLSLTEIITADAVSAPRKKVSAEYKDGRYLILSDTSGIVTKASRTVTETSIAFDAPHKERKPKLAPAVKPEKKPTPPAEKLGEKKPGA